MPGGPHPDIVAVASTSNGPPSSRDSVLDLLVRLAHAAFGLLADGARAARLSNQEFIALVRIVAADGMRPVDLSAILGISAGSMSELADRLEKRGLISRARQLEDRRGVLLRPTQRGRNIVERTLGPVAGTVVQVAASLQKSDRATVGRFLHEVAVGVRDSAPHSRGSPSRST